jgi:hypothetical protein
MAPGYCTQTDCPCCGYRFTVTTSTTTFWWPCTGTTERTYVASAERFQKLSLREINRLTVIERLQMARRPIERAPVPVTMLNAGMHIRQMRKSAGLARART